MGVAVLGLRRRSGVRPPVLRARVGRRRGRRPGALAAPPRRDAGPPGAGRRLRVRPDALPVDAVGRRLDAAPALHPGRGALAAALSRRGPGAAPRAEARARPHAVARVERRASPGASPSCRSGATTRCPGGRRSCDSPARSWGWISRASCRRSGRLPPGPGRCWRPGDWSSPLTVVGDATSAAPDRRLGSGRPAAAPGARDRRGGGRRRLWIGAAAVTPTTSIQAEAMRPHRGDQVRGVLVGSHPVGDDARRGALGADRDVARRDAHHGGRGRVQHDRRPPAPGDLPGRGARGATGAEVSRPAVEAASGRDPTGRKTRYDRDRCPPASAGPTLRLRVSEHPRPSRQRAPAARLRGPRRARVGAGRHRPIGVKPIGSHDGG